MECACVGWGRESLLLFSCGWEFMNMNRVVELGAQDRTLLQPRATSCNLGGPGDWMTRRLLHLGYISAMLWLGH